MTCVWMALWSWSENSRYLLCLTLFFPLSQAALAQELKVKVLLPGDPAPCHHVVAHFTRARPDQAEAKVVLRHLCALLRKLLKEPPALLRSYRLAS